MTSRRDAAVGALASLALVTLAVGPPVALALVVGSPLPERPPDWETVRRVLAGETPVAVTTWLKILACVLWLLWVRIAVGIAAEALRVARELPSAAAARVGPIQRVVARLVATAALVVSTASTRPAVAATPLQSLAVSVHLPDVVPAEPVDTSPTHAVSQRGSRSEAPAPAAYTVRPRDTLWGIAERECGDGRRWSELFDVNAGRPQPGGGTLTDPNVLMVGWVLDLPADARSRPDPANASYVVRAGDTLTEIADATLGDPGRFDELFELNAGRPQPNGGTLGDPNLLQPGWVLELPHVAADPPVAHPEPRPQPHTVEERRQPAGPPEAVVPASTPAQTAAPTSRQDLDRQNGGQRADEPAEPAGDTDDAPSRGGTPVPALGAGSALLAAGLSLLVAHLRRRQGARRRAGTARPAIPQAAKPVAEEVLTADVASAAAVSRQLRALARAVAAKPEQRCPRLRLVQVSAEQLELLWSDPWPATPDGWRPVAGGRVWERPIAAEVEEAVADFPVPVPALATIGRDDSAVLMDLEGEGLVAIVGDAGTRSGLARSLAIELASSPLGDPVMVLTVGLDVPEDRFEWLRPCADVQEALDLAAGSSSAIRARLAAWRYETTFAARSAGGTEPWTAAVVIVDGPAVDEARFAQLVELARSRGQGLAVVAVGVAPAGATVIEVQDGKLYLPEFGLAATAQVVDASASDAVASLLAWADADPVEGGQSDSEPERRDVQGSDRYEDPPYQALVQLLGPVTVLGGREPLRPIQVAIVGYLATHGPVTADQLLEAIWGENQPVNARKRLSDEISRIRHKKLHPDAIEALPNGRYRAGRRVVTDVELLRRRMAYAEHQPPLMAIDVLDAALDLVTGPPAVVDGHLRPWCRWLDTEMLHTEWEDLVVDAAHRLAELCLASGDPDGARRAAERGRKASPLNPSLIADEVTAWQALGDQNRARAIFDAYRVALEDTCAMEPEQYVVDLIERRRSADEAG
jgi:nucleoid-associated protein YgaU/DNA-binding SARP family transcriptional activator